MTSECFDLQLKRLRLRFGDKAFDSEFTSLIGKECANLSNYSFEKIVEIMIGTRKHTMPPLLIDFREMRIQLEKEAFNKTLRVADQSFSNAKNKPIESILDNVGYTGCKTIHEAIEVEIIKQKIAKADGGN